MFLICKTCGISGSERNVPYELFLQLVAQQCCIASLKVLLRVLIEILTSCATCRNFQLMVKNAFQLNCNTPLHDQVPENVAL